VYHHHVDLVQYRMMMIHMYFIVSDQHDDDGTHVHVLYQIYMMMMIYMYFILPDLHDDDGTHVPVLFVPSSSCRSGTKKYMCIIM
jgi:hypothetical protein